MIMNRMILAFVILVASISNAWCQDTVRVERIEFEFDENGAFMDEYPVFEESDTLKESEFERERENGVNRRLTIEPGTSTDIACVTLEPGLNAKVCSMEIFTLSGAKVYAAEIRTGRFRYNLSQLPKGEYIVTLSIDGRKESRKYSRR